MPKREAQMMAIDHVENGAGSEHGWDWSVGQEAPQAIAALGATLDLSPLRLDGAHADGGLGRPEQFEINNELGRSRHVEAHPIGISMPAS
jgi:hypothetical protein